jgi:GH25 family lysozyme M1 (1,4-beta-N-acetylmuramidase)
VSTLRTNDKGGGSLAALRQELQGALNRGLPFGQYEFVDVTFNSTAHGDTEVKHSLILSDPEAVRVIPVEWKFASTPVDPPYIWRNSASTRRPWGTGYIILRCNLSSAQGRLLLIAEAQ